VGISNNHAGAYVKCFPYLCLCSCRDRWSTADGQRTFGRRSTARTGDVSTPATPKERMELGRKVNGLQANLGTGREVYLEVRRQVGAVQ